MPEIALPTATKQNKILETLNDAEIFTDLIYADFSGVPGNSYSTLLNIQGAGEILEINLAHQNIGNAGLKITIDDKVFYKREASTNGSGNSNLFLLKKHALEIYDNYNNLYVQLYSSISKMSFTIRSSSLVDGTQIHFMQKPIQFSENLKVEAFNVYGSTTSSTFERNRIIYRLT